MDAPVTQQQSSIKAYRARLKASGWRRIDVTLTTEEWDALQALRTPGETHSLAIGRIITENFRKSRPGGAA